MNELCRKCGGMCCKTMIMPCQTMFATEFFTARGAKIADGKALIPSLCKQLKDGACKIYQNRPIACSVYLVGGEDCKLTRKLAGIK